MFGPIKACALLDEMQKCRDYNPDRPEKPWPIGKGGSFADIALRLTNDPDYIKGKTFSLLQKVGIATSYDEFVAAACKVHENRLQASFLSFWLRRHISKSWLALERRVRTMSTNTSPCGSCLISKQNQQWSRPDVKRGTRFLFQSRCLTAPEVGTQPDAC